MAVSRGRRREDKGVIVRHPVDLVSRPRVLLDVHVDFLDVPVLVEEVRAEQHAELLGRLDAVLLRQQVDRVLLAVRGDDVAVVAVQIVALRVEPQVHVYLVLSDLVTQRVLTAHVQQLHIVLSVAIGADLEIFPTNTEIASISSYVHKSIYCGATTTTWWFIEKNYKYRRHYTNI